MSPVKLCFQHRAPDADRSQVISLSSKGRSQEKRRGLCSSQRLCGACVGEGVPLPVFPGEERRVWPLAVGRHPAGGDFLPTSQCRDSGPKVLMSIEWGRSQGRQSEEAAMDIHGVCDNKKWP